MENSVKLKFHTKEVTKAMDDAASKRMLEAVNEVRNTTIDVLSQPGKGRIYTHYFFTDAQGRLRRGKKRWKPHQASAEGKPPARDTSELVQSIANVIEGEGRTIIGKVGTKLKYGKMLEFGTKKMAARPWLRPSFKKSLDKVKSILGRQWFR